MLIIPLHGDAWSLEDNSFLFQLSVSEPICPSGFSEDVTVARLLEEGGRGGEE